MKEKYNQLESSLPNFLFLDKFTFTYIVESIIFHLYKIMQFFFTIF